MGENSKLDGFEIATLFTNTWIKWTNGCIWILQEEKINEIILIIYVRSKWKKYKSSKHQIVEQFHKLFRIYLKLKSSKRVTNRGKNAEK